MLKPIELFTSASPTAKIGLLSAVLMVISAFSIFTHVALSVEDNTAIDSQFLTIGMLFLSVAISCNISVLVKELISIRTIIALAAIFFISHNFSLYLAPFPYLAFLASLAFRQHLERQVGLREKENWYIPD